RGRVGAVAVERKLPLIQEVVVGEGSQVDVVNSNGDLMSTVGEGQIIRHFQSVIGLKRRSGSKQPEETAGDVEARPVKREKLGDVWAQLVEGADFVGRYAGFREQPGKIESVVLNGEVSAAIAGEPQIINHRGANQIGVTDGEALDAIGLAVDSPDEEAAR